MIKTNVTTLGPGNRIVIWTSGCDKRCNGCMASHTWDFDQSLNLSVNQIIQQIVQYTLQAKIDGITISGGEPFLQNDLHQLLVDIRSLGFNDVLVYTGRYLNQIKDFDKYRGIIDVLIDGPYQQELNDDMPLRGSSNQNIYIFNGALQEKYISYLSKPRTFEMQLIGDVAIIIGLLPATTK